MPPTPEQAPRLLSQTGVFASLADLRPSPGLIPYDVNAPLWSDGAVKRRWVALPPGSRVMDTGGYKGRYELLRDLALDLFWSNRYPFTLYVKQPMRWRDVPRQRDDIFLPIFKPWEVADLASAIESGYRNLVPTWDEGTEDKIFRVLFDVFRHKKGAGAELSAIKPTVSEILANPRNLTYHLLTHDPDYPGYGWDDIIEYTHRVPEVEALMRQAMVLHNQYRWERAKTRVIEVGKLHDDEHRDRERPSIPVYVRVDVPDLG